MSALGVLGGGGRVILEGTHFHFEGHVIVGLGGPREPGELTFPFERHVVVGLEVPWELMGRDGNFKG